MIQAKVVVTVLFCVAFWACNNATDPSALANKLYLTVVDEQGTGLEGAGMHFYLDFSELHPKSQIAGLHDNYSIAADSIVLPHEYKLDQNYPNPFNPITTIGFTIPEVTTVTLQILNRTDSTVVKTLFDGIYTIGHYQVAWNCTNDSGLYLTNNVYYYQIRTKNFTDTKSLFLDMSDPEQIRSLNCLPLAISDSNGKIESDFSVFPLGEDITWTDETGNQIGTIIIPNRLNLVILKEGYIAPTVVVNIDTEKAWEQTVILKKLN